MLQNLIKLQEMIRFCSENYTYGCISTLYLINASCEKSKKREGRVSLRHLCAQF